LHSAPLAASLIAPPSPSRRFLLHLHHSLLPVSEWHATRRRAIL